jgi:acetyl-CoA synthetase
MHNLRIDEEKYLTLEKGNDDFSFTFLYNCANALGMDISELVSGDNPKLNFFNITRAGEGMPIKRREDFNYRHIAPLLKNRLSEPFIVTAKYDPAAQNKPIPLSVHKVRVRPYPQRLIKCSWTACCHAERGRLHYLILPTARHVASAERLPFLAVVYKSEDGKATDIEPVPVVRAEVQKGASESRYENLIYKKYVAETLNADGSLKTFEIHPTPNFNFSYDVLDALAEKCPDKRALVWVSSDKRTEHSFTFSEMSRLTNKTANYLRSLGIGKGDRVMLVLKRHYQFWMAILALHKLGAVAVPATHLLMEKDYEYRFNAGKIKAVICTAEDQCTDEIDKAAPNCPTLTIKSIVKGVKEGWSDFDAASAQSDVFGVWKPERTTLPSCSSPPEPPGIPKLRRTPQHTRSVTSSPPAGGTMSTPTDCTLQSPIRAGARRSGASCMVSGCANARFLSTTSRNSLRMTCFRCLRSII